MNKQFEYRGYKFNIKIELNTRVEKRINGDRYHTVTTNCLGYDNYYKKEEVNDKLLEVFIHGCEAEAQKYVDRKLDGNEIENRLSKLGFK